MDIRIPEDALKVGMLLRLDQTDNGTLLTTVIEQKPDDLGALYYVVVIISIYGCSILMMIASHIRKNKVDGRLNRYRYMYLT